MASNFRQFYYVIPEDLYPTTSMQFNHKKITMTWGYTFLLWLIIHIPSFLGYF